MLESGWINLKPQQEPTYNITFTTLRKICKYWAWGYDEMKGGQVEHTCRKDVPSGQSWLPCTEKQCPLMVKYKEG